LHPLGRVRRWRRTLLRGPLDVRPVRGRRDGRWREPRRRVPGRPLGGGRAV